ncbi:MAG: Bax inhibitor-1/YccA family protein [Bacteroidota bacterium]|nr:Bax inhibitor-1/YccA family protein [Candidatus Kapabacteria bacterium]MDW8219243.1 Bax inhibitor-1/YccA family protein [Bacteroidota bacterium]
MSSFGNTRNTQQRQAPRYKVPYKTSNPALSERRFASIEWDATGECMTLEGTVNKIGLLLTLCLASALFAWSRIGMTSSGEVYGAGTMLAIGGGGGFIIALTTAFVPRWSSVTAPLYAILEGLFIGSISAIFELSYPGIATQASALTFGVFIALLVAYKTRMIRVTETFRSAVVIATLGLALVYLVSLLLRFVTNYYVPLFEGGIIGIGLSLIVVAIAAANLLLDFDFIEAVAEEGAPKYMEWYSAFGLMVTLIWLYIEVLRLLAKLRDSD